MQMQLLRHTTASGEHQQPRYDFDAAPPAPARGGATLFMNPSRDHELARGISGPNPDGSPRPREPFPNYYGQVHALLNTADGRPSLAFYLIGVGVGIQVPHFIVGTFFTPGLLVAVHEGDSLTIVFISCVSIFMLLQVYGFTGLRKLGRQGGPLDVLGVGEQPLSRESLRTLRRAHKLLFPTQPIAALVPLCGVLISIFVIATGVGLQTSLWNRASALVWIFWPMVAGPLCLSWVFSLALAVTHCKDAIQLVVDEIKPPSPRAAGAAADYGHRVTATTLPEDQWTERVVQPTRVLARRTIPELSMGWSKIQGLCLVACFVAAIGLVSLSISPIFWDHVHASMEDWDTHWVKPMVWGVRCVIYGLIVVVIVVPLQVATGPAAVTTCCQRLKAALNELRMDDPQPGTHERVLILEMALTNLNNGQGMGFLLGMTVLNTATLTNVARGLVAAGSVLLPIALQLVPPAEKPTQCDLTMAQVATIQAAMWGAPDVCVYTNVTVADVLAMQVVSSPGPGSG